MGALQPRLCLVLGCVLLWWCVGGWVGGRVHQAEVLSGVRTQVGVCTLQKREFSHLARCKDYTMPHTTPSSQRNQPTTLLLPPILTST